MKRLTVVIVNYHSGDHLRQCLESLYRETKETSFQVVVVDNGSDGQEFARVAEEYAGLRLILNPENRGFAAACNQGIRACPAQYYLLLNPDCRVLDGAVDKMVRFMEGRSEAGIGGCRVDHPDGSLQPACRRSIPRPATAFYRFSGLSLLFPRSRRLASYNLSYLDEGRTHEVEAVSGSFLMFRHALLEDVGFLDERFFLYGEDLDFCYRAILKGWKVFYYPEARVVHYQYQSSRRESGTGAEHFYRSMEIFYQKHYGEGANWLKKTVVLGGIRLLRVLRGF